MWQHITFVPWIHYTDICIINTIAINSSCLKIDNVFTTTTSQIDKYSVIFNKLLLFLCSLPKRPPMSSTNNTTTKWLNPEQCYCIGRLSSIFLFFLSKDWLTFSKSLSPTKQNWRVLIDKTGTHISCDCNYIQPTYYFYLKATKWDITIPRHHLLIPYHQHWFKVWHLYCDFIKNIRITVKPLLPVLPIIILPPPNQPKTTTTILNISGSKNIDIADTDTDGCIE